MTAENNGLKTENAELRKERDFYFNQVIENGGRAQRAIDALNDENAKLRELVADMWFWHYEGHIDSESQERQMLHIDAVIQRMRELGVEVD